MPSRVVRSYLRALEETEEFEPVRLVRRHDGLFDVIKDPVGFGLGNSHCTDDFRIVASS